MPENECVFVAFAVLLFILCAVFSVCMLKRLRLIPLAVIGGSVCTICLYYGMCTKNVGFGFIIASLCGCAALAGYDHIYTRPKTIGAAVDAELPEDATISEWKEEKRRVLRAELGARWFHRARGGADGARSADRSDDIQKQHERYPVAFDTASEA